MTVATAEARLSLQAAERLAEKIRRAFEDVCARLMVVGSVRRRAESVKDIDVLMIPRPAAFALAADPPANAVEQGCAELLEQGRLLPGPRNGPRWKTFGIASRPGVSLELRITTPRRWPIEAVIHTGPAAFSKRFVTPRAHGGYLPDGYTWAGAASGGQWELLDPAGSVVALREERQVMELFCGRWIEPAQRG